MISFYRRIIYIFVLYKIVLRHGPFDIQGGGGGGLEFLSGPRIFFRTKSEQDYFFSPALWAGLFFSQPKATFMTYTKAFATYIYA